MPSLTLSGPSCPCSGAPRRRLPSARRKYHKTSAKLQPAAPAAAQSDNDFPIGVPPARCSHHRGQGAHATGCWRTVASQARRAAAAVRSSTRAAWVGADMPGTQSHLLWSATTALGRARRSPTGSGVRPPCDRRAAWSTLRAGQATPAPPLNRFPRRACRPGAVRGRYRVCRRPHVVPGAAPKKRPRATSSR